MTTAKIIESVMRAVPQITPYLKPETWAVFRQAEGYDGIRNNYWAIVYDAVHDYLDGDRPATSFKSAMKRGMLEAFTDAAELGYEEVGGELPMDDDTQDWLTDAQSAEIGHIDDLFLRLREEWDGLDAIDEAFARADGYTKTLDGIFAQAKMRGAKNATAEFVGDDGEKSCPDCQKLQGKRHRLSYIIENDLIPYPGNTNFECQGYECQHFWRNVKTGEEYRA
jgi:hypothetical protein